VGDRYGRSDINVISIAMSIWNMGFRYGIWHIDMVISHMVIFHIDMVILDIDMGYADDLGDDSIDMVILDIDMGYLVTLPLER